VTPVTGLLLLLPGRRWFWTLLLPDAAFACMPRRLSWLR
jgi:hypothetical protein